MFEKLYSSVSSNDDIVFVYIAFNIVTFFSIDISLNKTNLNKIKLDDNNFDNYDLLFMFILWAGVIDITQRYKYKWI